MSTMAENVIAVGSENRPPMLERSQYDSWQSRIRLYIREKEHGLATTPATIRERTLDDLTPEEKTHEYTQSYADNVARGNATGPGVILNTGNATANQSKEARVTLDKEQLAFLIDTRERVDSGLYVQALTTIAIFQTDDLDAFDSYCDEAPTSSAVFMVNLYAYDPYVLSEPIFFDDLNIEITSDNNIISYDQYMKENKVNLFKVLLLLNNKKVKLFKDLCGDDLGLKGSDNGSFGRLKVVVFGLSTKHREERGDRSHADPTILNDFEMAAEGNGDPPVPDLQTVEELCQPSLNEFLPISWSLGDNANKYLDKFLHVTQSIKLNEVTDDALRLYLFPHSLTHDATAWFDRLPRNSINTFEQMAKMFLGKYFPPFMVTKLRNEITNFRQRGTFMKRRPEECYDLIENMFAHHNDWDTLDQWSELSSSITSSSDTKIAALKAKKMGEINKNLMRVLQANHQVKAVTPSCETCGGPHSYTDCPATIGQTQNVYDAGAYQGIPTNLKDTVPPTNIGSTKDVQPPVVQTEKLMPNSEPVVAPIIEPVVAPTGRALIDVFEGKLTLRIGKEAITFNLGQKVLGFSDVIASDNPTTYYDPIVSTSSPNLTLFGDSDFLLKEVDAFLALEDDPNSPKVDQSYYDPEGDILLLEAFLNDDPSLPPPNQGNYLPQVELKDLPPHLEYAFLEGDNKLPVIIAKDLSDEEKTSLITVLKSHKRAIAWKLSDIKGINSEFCTHKILMEDDFEPSIQQQRRVNPKIHDVIKKEVLKLLPAGLIYLISDSPWVSPIHCVPKKGGFNVVENEENELIPTRLVTRWREKSHFMVKEGIVLDHKISRNRIEVDKAKVYVIAKLPHPTTVKGVVMGQRQEKHFRPIHYASKTMTKAESNYTTTKKEMLAVVYAFDKFWSYLIMNKSIMYTDHSALKYLFAKKDSKARLLQNVVPTKEQVLQRCKALLLGQPLFDQNLYGSSHPKIWNPRAIISDHGTHFCNKQLAKVMLKYGVTHHLATPYHPQTSGQVEVSNRGLKRILERTVGENRASWSDKLDDALWAFRIAYKTPIRCTPYKLVYKKARHLPIELEHKAYWALKHANFNLQTAGDHRKRNHDFKIKDHVFNVGDRVLLFNSRLKIFLGKLKTRWSGPLIITHVFPYGTVELSQTDWLNFKVNGHRLKHYFGEDIPKMVVLDLQTFSKD
uniref:Reverse transcriptase domain-containing protein n=1 Tax=Tanacetum cinerariifolium TaxID=118510 RepID=A0A6L2J8N6_TANCI|nr:reverse transcriptase domain-containing protein [Tanacetum cinerariifolium]